MGESLSDAFSSACNGAMGMSESLYALSSSASAPSIDRSGMCFTIDYLSAPAPSASYDCLDLYG